MCHSSVTILSLNANLMVTLCVHSFSGFLWYIVLALVWLIDEKLLSKLEGEGSRVLPGAV
jgi:hypothetical protein